MAACCWVSRGASYDLVLVDEAQDLNPANHAFLHRCVLAEAHHTVLCAVGDPAQAIYSPAAIQSNPNGSAGCAWIDTIRPVGSQPVPGFRGADPASMDTLRALFRPVELCLTCCFRCPRRVVAVATRLQPAIRAAPGAVHGGVRVRYARGPADAPWPAVLRLVQQEEAAARLSFEGVQRNITPL